MCIGGSPPPAPPPLPLQAPPPPPAVLESNSVNSTASALAANRGRGGLRIDKTKPDTGSTGNGLNIPT